MEIDISKKVNNGIKWTLAGIVIAAILCSVGVWFWYSQKSYLTISDAKVACTLVGAKAQVPGTIQELLVKDGEKVNAGQILAKVKVKISEDQIHQLEQSLELAKKNYTQILAGTTTSRQVAGSAPAEPAGNSADLERAARAKERMEQLYAIGAVSAVKYEQAQAEYQAAQAAANAGSAAPGVSYESVSTPSSPEAIKMAKMQIDQAQIALDTAKKNMESTDIVAPVAGTVFYTKLAAGADVEPGQSVVNIGDAANIWLELSLTKSQREKVRLGQFVSYTLAGSTVEGTVVDLEDPAESESKAENGEEVRYKAKVSLPAELAKEVKPGQEAVVKIALNA